MDDVERIAAGLTKAQRWFVSSLSPYWISPGSIGAKPNHGAHRDHRLIEARYNYQGRGYRLTPLGLRVAQHLKQENAKS